MMTEQQFLDTVHRRGAWQTFTYTTTDTPNRHWKGKVTLTRNVTMRGRTGVAYANLAANKGRELYDRKWGTRRDVYFIDHTPKTGPWAGTEQVYATIIPVEGSFRTQYFVDGQQVDRDTYNGYRTASAAADREPTDYMDINLQTLTAAVTAAPAAA